MFVDADFSPGTDFGTRKLAVNVFPGRLSATIEKAAHGLFAWAIYLHSEVIFLRIFW